MGTSFGIPEPLPFVLDEAPTVISFLGVFSFGVMFCWLVFNLNSDSEVKISVKRPHIFFGRIRAKSHFMA